MAELIDTPLRGWDTAVRLHQQQLLLHQQQQQQLQQHQKQEIPVDKRPSSPDKGRSYS